jgi:uncharacterized membrane protein
MRGASQLNHARGGRSRIAIEVLEQRAYFSVDLTGSISVVGPGAKPGGHITIAIQVVNNGTTVATGKLTTDLSASAIAGGAPSFSFPAVAHSIHLEPGAQTTIKVTEKIPSGSMPGAYFVDGDIDPADTFSESNLANNVVASSNTMTVLSLYPDAIGTLDGVLTIKKGADKGLIFTQTIHNTSENFATGIISFTGTSFFPNGTTLSFAGETALKTNGSFTATGTDVPEDSAGVFHNVGKISGDTSKGTFVNAINSGTFIDTPA